MTYTWFFSALDVHPSAEGQTDVVHNIYWKLGGDDGDGNSAFLTGGFGCTYAEGDPFTPFADLTESDVEGWTTAHLGDDEVARLKARIDAMIEEKITPTTKSMTPPWLS
jgi:hypothetical protein|tara:strand:+ start:439 stop:765 length:327 start_codon:yes stop_codon:yes gene_type:complete